MEVVDLQGIINRNTSPVSEHIVGFSRDSDFFQVPNPARIFKGPVEAATVDSPVPLIAEVHLGNVQPRRASFSHVDASLIARPTRRFSFASQQTRGFHSSPRVAYDSTSYNVSDVPDFFIKYKQHRATSTASVSPLVSTFFWGRLRFFKTFQEVFGREQEELGLMQPLTHSIQSGDVVATTRRLQAKIPVEHHVADGHIIHPSGFVVPGPGHTSTSDVARAKERERNEGIDRAIQTAAVAHRVLESDFEQVDATTIASLSKVPFEVRESDGTVKHPSGFVPPTPDHKFRYNVNMVRDRKVSATRQKVRPPSPTRGVLRAVHTSAPRPS